MDDDNMYGPAPPIALVEVESVMDQEMVRDQEIMTDQESNQGQEIVRDRGTVAEINVDMPGSGLGIKTIETKIVITVMTEGGMRKRTIAISMIMIMMTGKTRDWRKVGIIMPLIGSRRNLGRGRELLLTNGMTIKICQPDPKTLNLDIRIRLQKKRMCQIRTVSSQERKWQTSLAVMRRATLLERE